MALKMDKKKNIEYQLEIERKDAQNPNIKEYDFIYPLSHITSIDEQRIKVEEITNITKIKKKK
jgi:predicted phage-related endonuclease